MNSCYCLLSYKHVALNFHVCLSNSITVSKDCVGGAWRLASQLMNCICSNIYNITANMQERLRVKTHTHTHTHTHTQIFGVTDGNRVNILLCKAKGNNNKKFSYLPIFRFGIRHVYSFMFNMILRCTFGILCFFNKKYLQHMVINLMIISLIYTCAYRKNTTPLCYQIYLDIPLVPLTSC